MIRTLAFNLMGLSILGWKRKVRGGDERIEDARKTDRDRQPIAGALSGALLGVFSMHSFRSFRADAALESQTHLEYTFAI